MMQQVDLLQLSEMMTIQQAARPKASFGNAVSFAQVQQQVSQSDDASSTDWFRSTIHQSLAHITIHRSVARTAVDITPEALEAMRQDPAYRRQVIALVNRDLSHSYYPREVNVFVHVGETLSAYGTQTFDAGQDEAFDAISEGAFFEAQQSQTLAEKELSPQAQRATLFRDHMNAQLAAHSYRAQPRTTATAYQQRAYSMF